MLLLHYKDTLAMLDTDIMRDWVSGDWNWDLSSTQNTFWAPEA